MDKVANMQVYNESLAVIKLNRPEKRNAISTAVINQLDTYLTDLEHNPAIKLLILTGEGSKAFCAGGDLAEFHGEMNAKEAYEMLRPMKTILFRIATLPFPTLAWMNGSARGGGMELASACDFRFASSNGNYGFVQGQLGIAPGWGGGALLYHRIQPQLAYLWLVEAEIKNANELHASGFVHRIVEGELNLDANELSMFLTKSIEQLRGLKKQWLDHMSVDRLAKDMEEEVAICSELWESEAHIEAVKSFFQKKSD